MEIKEFKIIFDTPRKTYFPGQTVKARLYIAVDTPLKYQAMKIIIKGEAKTFLTKYKQKRVSAIEEYFVKKFCVAEGAPGEELELQPGVQEYPFVFDLPGNLPSSLESEFGNIKYTIKGTIDYLEIEETFLVISKYNLNRYPRITRPYMEEKIQIFGCCIPSSLIVSILLPFRGYVPGQLIPVSVIIENEHEIGICDVQLSLKMIVTYSANSPNLHAKTHRFTISKINKGPVEGNFVSYEQHLKVPPIPPSSLNNCSIIDTQYVLQLKACVRGWFRRNLKMVIPIFIGTDPVINYRTIMTTSRQNCRVDEGQMHLSPSEDPYFDSPPPTYEESILMERFPDQNTSENISLIAK